MVTARSPAREVGRQAFGENPGRYHSARPPYPEWVYDTLVSRCGLRDRAAVFEIGAGSGLATERLLDLGANPLVAIEPDRRSADFLRANRSDKALEVVVAPFEEAVLEEGAFDLGVSATAFHWLEEDTALAKVAYLLRPHGWWCAIWNVFGDASRPDAFHEATKELLEAPVGADERDIPHALAEARMSALRRTGAFDTVEHTTSQWPLVLDADQTVALYATFSNLSARTDREAVLDEIGRISRERFGGRVVRNMTTSLYIARRDG